MTLWAQWALAGNSWFVIYNANGGTTAPGAQILAKGTDAVLSTEIPENGSAVFKGWALSPHAAEPDYQPGDTLPYDSNKSFVVLYALWELSPIDRPAVITFDANGGPADAMPHSLSAPKMVWLHLPSDVPIWDPQHPFLGWSEDPKTTEPTWEAGDVVIFNKDTTLYAIWNPQYKVIEGANSVWVKGSGKPHRFVADGNIEYFRELRVDGVPLMDGVKFTSGSTIADIPAAAMEKLSVGEHTITFVYMDGEASAKFTVQAATPPKPINPNAGDATLQAFHLVLVTLALVALGVLMFTRRSASTLNAKRKK